MRLRHLSISWFVLMCMLQPAQGHQIQLGVDQGFDVDSNAFSSSTGNEFVDGRYRLSPIVKIAQPESDFTYLLRYQPTYTGYFRADGINGFDHNLHGRGAYEINGRDKIRFTSNFIRAATLRSTVFADAFGQFQVLPTRSGTSQRFSADLAFDRSLSARTTATAALNYNRWDYSSPTNVNNQGFGGELQLATRVAPRWQIGGNLSARYRSFEETASSAPSFTTVVNANLLASFQVTETLVFQASGGPAGVIARQGIPGATEVSRFSPIESSATCPVGPCGRFWFQPVPTAPPTTCIDSSGFPLLNTCLPTAGPVTGIAGFPDETSTIFVDPADNVFGNENKTLTYFISATLSQAFARGVVDVSFVRNEDAGSGVGSSTILNVVRAGVTYQLTDLWNLRVDGSYSNRVSVSSFPAKATSARDSGLSFSGQQLAEANSIVGVVSNRNFEQDIGVFQLLVRRQLGEHTRISFRFRYYNQRQFNAFGTGTQELDRFTGGVFYVYQFDPIQL